MSRPLRLMALGLLAFALIQLVPYGRDHSNPPATRPLKWDAPATETFARRACFDCHSNETRWPWYASVAPLSWRIQHDVAEGREHLNFSSMDLGGKHEDDAREAGKTVLEARMPPRDYQLVHPESRLTPAERRLLAEGLDRSLARYRFPTSSSERGDRGPEGDGSGRRSDRRGGVP